MNVIVNGKKFEHRKNADGSFDSICLQCFQTVVNSRDESALSVLETSHKCDGWKYVDPKIKNQNTNIAEASFSGEMLPALQADEKWMEQEVLFERIHAEKKAKNEGWRDFQTLFLTEDH